MGKLSIDFNKDTAVVKTPVVIPPAPTSNLRGILPDTIETEEERRGIVCTDYLDKEALEGAQKKAEELYPKMLANYTELIQYGKKEIAQLNDLINRMDSAIELVEVPDLLRMARELGKEIEGLQTKYDPQNEEVQKRIAEELNGDEKQTENQPSFVRQFIAKITEIRDEEAKGNRQGAIDKAASLIQEIRVIQRTIEQNISRVEAIWQEKVTMLEHNVALDDDFYIQNEVDIIGVIGVVAVLEIIRAKALGDIKQIEIDVTKASDRLASERKNKLTAFVDALNMKINEYRNRMIIGWTTSPQITNRRNSNVALIMKLDSQRDLIVPMLKSIVQGWTLNIQSQGVGELTDSLSRTTEKMLVSYAESSAKMMPEIARAAHKTTLSAEVIDRVADFVAKENDDTLAVLEETRMQHEAASSAMVRAQRLMLESSEAASDLVLAERITKAADRLSS